MRARSRTSSYLAASSASPVSRNSAVARRTRNSSSPSLTAPEVSAGFLVAREAGGEFCPRAGAAAESTPIRAVSGVRDISRFLKCDLERDRVDVELQLNHRVWPSGHLAGKHLKSFSSCTQYLAIVPKRS